MNVFVYIVLLKLTNYAKPRGRTYSNLLFILDFTVSGNDGENDPDSEVIKN